MTVKIVVFESTAVASVPVASAVVVLIVTLFVSSPSEHLAFLAAFGLRFVQACALFAVQK